VLEYEPGDLTCIVEAGMRWRASALLAGQASGCRLTRRAIRRSANACSTISPGRFAIASGRCAI